MTELVQEYATDPKPGRWRFAFASVAGTSHHRTETPCHDAAKCCVLPTSGGEAILVAVAADGAGSAQHAQIGAELACELFVSAVEELLEAEGSVEEVTETFMQRWLMHFHSEIDGRAEVMQSSRREFACTLLAAVVSGRQSKFVQIGDGAIVIPSADGLPGYEAAFWPERGEYANQTYFATDDLASQHLQFKAEGFVDEVALLTDGLERLALHYGDRRPHTPFFDPMFKPLRNADEEQATRLSSSLVRYLDSKAINERTDDDKTLILATRRTISADSVTWNTAESASPQSEEVE